MFEFWKAPEGSTRRLIQLCAGYFTFYVITGVTVKYFLGSAADGRPGMKDLEFLVYSTAGGTGICLAWVFARGWWRLQSNGRVQWGALSFPGECLYIVPSGLCTAVVIPTTTLMYTLPISVMVAMVIMRGSVIIISRVVDAVQIRQGILKKRVYWEENVAVLCAIGAMSLPLVWDRRGGGFDFLGSPAAMTILGSYIVAYLFRIYIMNYYKNTRAPGVHLDNNGFFAVEQIAASAFMVAATVLLFNAPSLFGWNAPQIDLFRGAIADPRPLWGWAILAGTAYGIVAFFSVFLFMFKGRTATFAGLVNRLTSLIAGTTATVVFHLAFGGKAPKPEDWGSLALIFVAVGFLTRAERKRTAELLAAHEIDAVVAHAAKAAA